MLDKQLYHAAAVKATGCSDVIFIRSATKLVHERGNQVLVKVCRHEKQGYPVD